jgi:hypothetical protein
MSTARPWRARVDGLVARVEEHGRTPHPGAGNATEHALGGWVDRYRTHARNGAPNRAALPLALILAGRAGGRCCQGWAEGSPRAARSGLDRAGQRPIIKSQGKRIETRSTVDVRAPRAMSLGGL